MVRIIDGARGPVGESLDVLVKAVTDTQACIGELKALTNPFFHWLG
jgi:hypothetical protein